MLLSKWLTVYVAEARKVDGSRSAAKVSTFSAVSAVAN